MFLRLYILLLIVFEEFPITHESENDRATVTWLVAARCVHAGLYIAIYSYYCMSACMRAVVAQR